MAFVVETGTGSVTANSLCSEADATAYIALYYPADAWNSATSGNRQQALLMATQYMEAKYRRRWAGVRQTAAQALAWPRSEVEDGDGYEVAESTVPQAVKNATAELALRSLAGTLLVPDITDDSSIKMERIKVGPIETETEYSNPKESATTLPVFDIVNRILADFIGAENEIRRA